MDSINTGMAAKLAYNNMKAAQAAPQGENQAGWKQSPQNFASRNGKPLSNNG